MRDFRPTLSRVPVWIWRALMAQLAPSEKKRFNAEPINSVTYDLDIDYFGNAQHSQRLDVIAPKVSAGRLPVYVYFHGGGWTSGDKEPLTKYCASQAAAGMVVVNVNYRKVSRLFHMTHMLQDANASIRWVTKNIASYGGDPSRIVLGGDSAGGQIAALLAATATHQELADHYGIRPALEPASLRGLVQHCSVVDFSVMFERGFIMSLEFVRMLLPTRRRGDALVKASRYLSPIEWLDDRYPPVLVTTSEQDYFYRANLNFIERLRLHSVKVDTLILDRTSRNARHTWQQDASFPESQAVYRKLHSFVEKVATPTLVSA